MNSSQVLDVGFTRRQEDAKDSRCLSLDGAGRVDCREMMVRRDFTMDFVNNK